MNAVRTGPLRGPFFFAVAFAATIAWSGASVAEREYAVYFDTAGSERREIGTLVVSDADADNGFAFTLNDEVFGDYFLSMRPFKCIEQGDQMLCYLPYPYENRRNLGADLTDLEYDLLFIARSPTEYGIDPWNGRYFRLAAEDDGFRGEIFETDLDILAAPPDDGGLRPLAGADMVPVESGGRQWAPTLVIELRRTD